MTISCMMDDYCPRQGLRGEHGLSLFLQAGDFSVIFDTGQGGRFMENAADMGIDLREARAIVLSHGHYDHCGGLGKLRERLAPDCPPIYAGRGWDAPKMARDAGGLVDIGQVRSADSKPTAAVVVETLTSIAPGIFLLPAVARPAGSADNPRFRTVDGRGETVDRFEDELSLVVVEEDGLTVIAGCAHRGILNIAAAALQAFPGKVLKTLAGGFHLADAAEDALAAVASGLAGLEPGRVLCSHCTGPRGYAALLAALGNRVTWLSCGMRVRA